METSSILSIIGAVGVIFALAGFVSIFLVTMSYVLSNKPEKIRKNKGSIWICHHCKLRYGRDVQVIWTWIDVAGCGTPICKVCDSDMDLDVEATKNL